MDCRLPYHLLRLARPHTCAGGLLAALAGVHLAGGDPEPVRMVLAGAGIVLLIAAAQTYNDARDAVADRIAKPNRPVAAGAVSARTATIAAATYVALAVASAVPLGVPNVALALVLAGASYAYSAGLKGRPLLGNLLVGVTTGSAAVYGALAVGRVGGSVLAAWATIAAYLTSFEVLKTVRDREEDASVGLRTMALVSVPASFAVFRLLSVVGMATLIVMGLGAVNRPVFYTVVALGLVVPALCAFHLARPGVDAGRLRRALFLVRLSWFPALAVMFLIRPR
jgi:4-hydroxybenzoate polyprenyltransferase